MAAAEPCVVWSPRLNVSRWHMGARGEQQIAGVLCVPSPLALLVTLKGLGPFICWPHYSAWAARSQVVLIRVSGRQAGRRLGGLVAPRRRVSPARQLREYGKSHVQDEQVRQAVFDQQALTSVCLACHAENVSQSQ